MSVISGPGVPRTETAQLVTNAPAEVTIVLPCLDEAETLVSCLEEVRVVLLSAGITAEVIVADNGSLDNSRELAVAHGAKVVQVAPKGYGNALRHGVAAACGRFVVFGDSDGSYSFHDIPKFLERLRAGDQLVVGNRFKGRIHKHAMPWLHRYIGNPVLSAIGRVCFKAPVGDFHCGLRGVTKEAFERMALRTTGMEFASEMIIRAKQTGLRISELPVDLRPDGRSRRPHLRPWRDGWRHLKLMMLMCPMAVMAVRLWRFFCFYDGDRDQEVN